MTHSGLARTLAALAGLMGASGVALAAMAAHLPDATRLGTASSMLLFHAAATLGAVALSERHILQPRAGRNGDRDGIAGGIRGEGGTVDGAEAQGERARTHGARGARIRGARQRLGSRKRQYFERERP